MFGKNEREKEREARQQEQAKQRKHSMEQTALQHAANDDKQGGEILRQLSEIDDLPEFEGRTLNQFVSKVISTSNLSEEDLASDEWVREYVLMMYHAQFPPEYGLTGHARAYALDDKAEKRDPLDAETTVEAEMFKHTSGLALTRSEDMAATKEATRTIAETLSRDGSEEKEGGLLHAIGLK